MSIEGLRPINKPNEIDMSDHINASVKALSMLGLAADLDRVKYTVEKDYLATNQYGRAGEAYIPLPKSLITLGEMVARMDRATYPNDRQYPKTFVYDNLWTPGVDPNGYTPEELDNLTLGDNNNFAPHARLAVFNTANPEDPLLHFLGQPYDKKLAKEKEQTQLEAIELAKQKYEAEGHEGLTMTPLNAKAIAFIALVRLIKGQDMPISWGFMRDATLPQKEVDGNSVVGYVYFYSGRFDLNRSYGDADSNDGVGLSVGPRLF